MKRKLVTLMLAMACSFVALTGCGSSSEEATEYKNEGDPIIVASMTPGEDRIFGEIMVQILESNGYLVDSSGVGTYNNNTLPRQSLLENQIDIVMDFTGRGYYFIEDVDSSLYTESLELAFETTRDADLENGLVWLCYAPYNNTNGICVDAEWAEENGIVDFYDLADYLNAGGEFKVAIATENSYAATDPTCIPGWEEVYGFELTDDQMVVGVSDPQSLVANNTDGINAAHCYTTEGTLEALGLYVIEDPEYVSPIYSPAAICTAEILETYPELEEIFNYAFEQMTEDKIRELNKREAVDGESPADLAAEFLAEIGL